MSENKLPEQINNHTPNEGRANRWLRRTFLGVDRYRRKKTQRVVADVT